MDVDKSIKYTERILRVSVLKKYRQVLSECKGLTKGLYGYQWTLGLSKVFQMETFCIWSKVDAINGAGYLCTG